MDGVLGGLRKGTHYRTGGPAQGQGLLLLGLGEEWSVLPSTGDLRMKRSSPTEEWGTGSGEPHRKQDEWVK